MAAEMRAALMAEFDSEHALIDAIGAIKAKGYTELDAYTPYPTHHVEDAMKLPRSKVPLVVLLAGMTGASAAYFLQWYISVIDYPLDVGGRPTHAALSFVPITFEMGVLFAAFGAIISLFVFAGLPRLWHPVFAVPGFDRASIDRFWISIDVRDPKFDRDQTAADLTDAGAVNVEYTGDYQ